MKNQRNLARVDINGLAITGTLKRDIMGIRFAEDGEVDPDAPIETPDPVEDEPVEDARDATITQITAALVAANATITSLRAANAALILSIPGGDPDEEEASPSDDDDPELEDLFKED